LGYDFLIHKNVIEELFRKTKKIELKVTIEYSEID
jgi:hypothetical protein